MCDAPDPLMPGGREPQKKAARATDFLAPGQASGRFARCLPEQTDVSNFREENYLNE